MISNDKLLGAISRHDRKSPKRRRFGTDSKNFSIRLSWHLKGLIIKLIVQAQDQLSWQKFIKTFSRKICIRSEAIDAWETRGGWSRIKLKGYSPEGTFFLFLYSLSLKALTEHGKTITNVGIENVTERITTPDKGTFFSNFERAYTGLNCIVCFVAWKHESRCLQTKFSLFCSVS